MKVLIALVGGYLIGARAGSRDFDQLSKSLRARSTSRRSSTTS